MQKKSEESKKYSLDELNIFENEVKAKLNDGILTVSVTKLDTPLTKRIINIE